MDIRKFYIFYMHLEYIFEIHIFTPSNVDIRDLEKSHDHLPIFVWSGNLIICRQTKVFLHISDQKSFVSNIYHFVQKHFFGHASVLCNLNKASFVLLRNNYYVNKWLWLFFKHYYTFWNNIYFCSFATSERAIVFENYCFNKRLNIYL